MRGEADLAVRVREVDEPGLVVRKLAVSGWSMYAAPAYVARKGAPATPEELQGHELVGFDKSMGAVPGALWLDEHGKGAQVVMRGNSIVAALNAAILGLGLTMLPCFMADPEPALQRITPRVLGVRDVFLVAHPDLTKVAKVRTVMDFIVQTFERDAQLWSG
jgi:DNA-binding transcriptional LysR family regulator